MPAPPDPASPHSGDGDGNRFPPWFTAFLDDRQTRKPSAHTMKAYRQDFVAIAALAAGDPARFGVADITKESMRAAFAGYARRHEAGAPARMVRAYLGSAWV